MTYKIHKVQGYLLVIDDDSNVLAHLPLDGYPIQKDVPLLPPIEDDVIELADEWVFDINGYKWSNNDSTAGDNFGSYIAGYNKAREKYKYTEEDMRNAIEMARPQGFTRSEGYLVKNTDDEIIQSLHQYPTEFECEMVDFTVTKEVDYSITYSEHEPKPKTITTAQGKQWVGKYK